MLATALLGWFAIAGCERNKPAVVPDTATSPAAPVQDGLFQEQLNRGTGLMGQFQYAEAWALFEPLSKQYPDDLELIVNTAIARLNMAGDKDLEYALQLLETVLTREPRNLRANYCAGLIKTYLGPPADPLPHFRIAAELDPHDADVIFLLAKAQEQAEELDAASLNYQRCLEINEYYASALLGLGRIERMAGNMEQATQWLEQFESMKSNPNCRVFEFAYKRMGQYGEVAVSSTNSQKETPQSLPDGQLFGEPRKVTVKGGTLFPPTVVASGLASPAITPVDLNHDGKIDLLLHVCSGNDIDRGKEVGGGAGLVQVLNDGVGGFEVLEAQPWSKISGIEAVLCGDIDQDGTNDLYLCRQGENQLWLQTEAGKWQRSGDAEVGGGEFHTTDGLLCDADHDGDLDLICANVDGNCRLIFNNRDGTWRGLEKDQAFVGPANWLTAGDFDNQRDLDLFLGGSKSGSTVLKNERLWRYQIDETAPANLLDSATLGSVCLDFDDDGWNDLVNRRTNSFEIWSRARGSDWAMKKSIVPDPSENSPDAKHFAVVDLNGDGSREILVADDNQIVAIDGTGKLLQRLKIPGRSIVGWNKVVLQPELGWSIVCVDDQGELWEFPPGPGRHQFVALQFTGKERVAESMRSNRSGIGTRWKARIGNAWTTGTGLDADTLPGQSLQPQLIGLRGHQQIDFLAVDWSDGVFQVELALESGKIQLIEETQRQLASCPVVFAWNGKQIDFVTDILGVGGIGFFVAPGQYAPSRPWENLHLTDKQLQPRDGRMLVKIGEPMEEACYLQSAKLISIDVPPDWQVVIDERMGISDPQPSGKPCFFRRQFPVAEARDRNDIDQTAALKEADGTPADVGELDHRFIGLLRSEQELEFSFGQPMESGARPALVIDGWVEYPYSQTVFGAWQAGRSYEPPSLEVSEDGQNWEPAWQQFGYPAGMPRTMLLPLPKEAAGKTWFRFRTNMQVYWDRIRLVYLEDCEAARLKELPLELAELRRTGFALRTTRPWFNPWYDYSQRRGTWDARHLPGFYTRFGEVTELFAETTGALAIFGPGEEIHLEFAAAPESESGWQRSHVLQVEGWCKDVDLYTQTGDSLEPLPNASYDPQTASRRKALERKYNWRYESGPWFPVNSHFSNGEKTSPSAPGTQGGN